MRVEERLQDLRRQLLPLGQVDDLHRVVVLLVGEQHDLEVRGIGIGIDAYVLDIPG